MKIAIHHNPGSFSDRWIEYCKEKEIPYKVVNAYDSDIVTQLEDCDVFMWHHHHADYKDVLFAKQLLYSLELSGKEVFPNYHTTWHFDDKVGQKYLLESLGAPLVPSYVFYTKKDAYNWVNNTTFPKVFKLRGGASSANVRLVHNKREAIKLIDKAFSKGFSQFDGWSAFKDRLVKWKGKKESFWGVCKGFARIFISTEFARMHAPEKGYAYFQDFIPNNQYDLRIVVVGGNKAFGIKRLVRQNDFRASGSGSLIYEKSQLNENCVKIAFDIAKKIKSQSIAFDFIYDKNNKPLIVEISYGYAIKAYYPCQGYWTDDMQWHQGSHFDIEGWMIENLLNKKQ